MCFIPTTSRASQDCANAIFTERDETGKHPHRTRWQRCNIRPARLANQSHSIRAGYNFEGYCQSKIQAEQEYHLARQQITPIQGMIEQAHAVLCTMRVFHPIPFPKSLAFVHYTHNSDLCTPLRVFLCFVYADPSSMSAQPQTCEQVSGEHVRALTLEIRAAWGKAQRLAAMGC